MTLMEIIIKIALFFGVFYGAIAISSFASAKIRKKLEKREKEL